MTEPFFNALWQVGKAAAAKLCPQALAGMIAAERARRGIRQGARMARRMRDDMQAKDREKLRLLRESGLPLLLIWIALSNAACASVSVREIEIEGGRVSTCRRMQYNVIDAVIWIDDRLPGK